MDFKRIISIVQMVIAFFLILGSIYSVYLVNNLVGDTLEDIPEEHQKTFSKIPLISMIVAVVVSILSILIILQGINNFRKNEEIS